MATSREGTAVALATLIAHESSRAGRDASAPRMRTIALWLGLFALALFAIRLSASPAFSDNEWRLSAYALDAVQNGRWLSQTDTLGEVAAKPPLLTWLVALTVLPTGQVSQVAIYWPSAFATIVTAWVLLHVGRSHFGWRAGLLGSVSYLASNVAFDQMRTARYDAILSLAVILGAVAAWRAWQTGQGWTWFWTVAALGTLVKGPLAALLPAAGLLARLWKEPSGIFPPVRGTHRAGLAIYLAMVGGWFIGACLQGGPPVIEKMLHRELMGHAIGTPAEQWRGFRAAYEQPWFLLIGYAPWSLLTIASAYRALTRPAEDLAERRFERFILIWLTVDLLIFSMAAHHRARLIYPVVPAAALLAGRELGRWTVRLNARTLLRASAALGLALLAVSIVGACLPGRRGQGETESLAARDLARALQGLGPGEFPLTYVDGWKPLQIWRNTRRVITPVEQGAEILRGDEAAFVVVSRSHPALGQALGGHPAAVLFRWPPTGKARVQIVSNHPRLEWPDRTVIVLDGLRVQMEAAHLLRTAGDELIFLAGRTGAAVSLTNRSPASRNVRLRFTRPGSDDLVAEQRLASGASWREGWTTGSAR